MSGNSFGLYSSSGGNVTVGAGNTSGLYRLDTAVIVDTGYGNVDVQAFLEQYTGNIQCGNIDVLNTANINALYATNYYYANGTPFVPSGYGNANVAAFLPTYTGNLAGSNLGLTGNILVGQNIVSTGNVTSGQNIIAGGDVQAAGNLRTTGVSGNITGANYVVASYFVGDGSQLSNITGSYGNSNVSNYLASGTNTANIVTTGNISGSYILGNGSQLTGLPATYSNAEVATFLANFGSNSISTTGNITAGLFTGSGAGLTNLSGANVTGQVANALVAGTVYTAAQPNITSVGTLTSLTVSGNVTAGNISTSHIDTTGNVTISGVLFSDDITSTSVTVYGDQVITGNLTVQGNTTTINSNVITTNDKTITVANNQSTGANVNGAGIEAGNPAIATWLYNDLTTSWQSNVNLTPTSNITLNLGTNTNRWATVYAQDANLTGTATAAAFVGDGSGLTNLTGANITGTVANAAYATTAGHASTANTVTDAAQPAITSVGTLVSLGVTGNITSSGNISGSYILGNGSQLTGLPETYGNANVANFLANYGSNTIVTTGNITGGNITGGNIVIPSGQLLTGDFGSSANVSKAWVQTEGTGTTAPTYFQIRPGVNSTGNLGATVGVFQSNSVNNSSFLGLYAYATESRIQSAATGTGTLQPITFTFNNTEAARITTGGNVGIGNTAPTDKLAVSGDAYVSGNITGSYFLGNGSQLTGIVSSYGNANVTTLLANLGSNAISSTANITTTANVAANSISTSSYGKIQGDFSSGVTAGRTLIQTTNTSTSSSTFVSAIPGANNTNANQAGFGAFGTADIGNASFITTLVSTTDGRINVGRNGTGSFLPFTVWTSNAEKFRLDTVGNVGIGNTAPNDKLSVNGTGYFSGNIAVAGILTDGYYYANGTPFTGSGSTYGNANVADFLANYGSNTISSTGNITTTGNVAGAYFIGNGSQLTGITSSYGDANVTTLLASLGSNIISSTANITTTGNVSGGNLLGVGSGITGINAFGNIAIAGQTTVSADNTTDTLTLVAGTNITLTTDAANNKITITSTASGGGETLSPFLLMGG